MSSRRQKQVNQTIRRELSDILSRHVNDPRINGIISITEVNVSPDLTQAKVFISVMGSDEEKAEIFEGLASAAEFLRRELGSRLRLRHIPRLVFEKDDSIEKAEHLFQLIDQSVDNDSDE